MEYTHIDLHTHCVLSTEGRRKQKRGFAHIPPTYAPLSLLTRARQVGLDFIALTDHNMMPSITHNHIIPGVELTCKPASRLERVLGETHLIILNPKQDFFNTEAFPDLYETIESAHADGSVLILPHPFYFDRSKKNYYKMLSGVETYYSYKNPLTPLLRKNALRINALGPACVAGSDAHTLDMLGCAQNVVEYCPTVDHLLTEIENRAILHAQTKPSVLNSLRTLIAN
ncbi:hypothetical protein COT72_05345 [archaeon CG10_big_fil_rev_8_21_14_0_10_43_11]|nr:MAG: hypothetical protein COT72_05345 [archaeon CG10_big_fil_rev_8_21_14_0_10_43_11]